MATNDSKERLARLKGLVPSYVTEAHVMVVGAGSVGSQIADGLARAGVGKFTIIDHDSVEAANLSRTVYRASDIGTPKTTALSRHLKAIDPQIVVEDIPTKLQDTDRGRLKAAFSTCDFIVCAADDVAAQILLNRISQAYQKPAMFVGIYARAAGGEVALSVPGLSACFECYMGNARSTDGVTRKLNYGTGRLAGEIGLGADILHVTSSATKIALALLSALSGDGEAQLSKFLLPLFITKQTVALFGMEPEYFIFPEAMNTARAQYAFQSVWLTVHRKIGCPACSGILQQDPIAIMTGSVTQETAQNLRKQVTARGREGTDAKP